MTLFSRRVFVAGAATIPFGLWLQRVGLAQSVVTRYDATSADGQRMLRIYAAAAAKMMNTVAEGDPTSWVFQWYTHGVRPDRTKAAEIARVYPQAGTPRTLAQDMWSTCQAHFVPQNEPFFLPWHRMYVYFFERIIRKVSGEASFTLPYWNYSVADPARHGILPREFRMPGDPVFRALYRANRNAPDARNPRAPNVNNGDPIDKGLPNSLSLAALKQGTYLPQGALQGLNQSLDFGLHGSVHVEIGNTENMGNVPWAARDPIFWVHHCNIDRLWASWNRNGGVNPAGAWLNQTFVFADENGNRVVAKVDDFKDIATLGYAYDRLESAPPTFRPHALVTESLAPPAPDSVVVMQARVELGAGPTRVALEPVASAPGAGSLPERARGLSANRRLYLVVRDIRAAVAPGVMYNVYLDLPTASAPSDATPHHVGSIGFFGAVPHEGHPMDGAVPDPRFISFDVTEVVRDLQARQLLADKPVVTIAPVGRPAANAQAVIGALSLAEQ
jgi:tyrosinase